MTINQIPSSAIPPLTAEDSRSQQATQDDARTFEGVREERDELAAEWEQLRDHVEYLLRRVDELHILLDDRADQVAELATRLADRIEELEAVEEELAEAETQLGWAVEEELAEAETQLGWEAM